jgi:hypothetical protein
MNLLEALVTLADATVDMDGVTPVRRARRKVEKKIDALRAQRQRRKPAFTCPACHGRGWVYALTAGTDIRVDCSACCGGKGPHLHAQ